MLYLDSIKIEKIIYLYFSIVLNNYLNLKKMAAVEAKTVSLKDTAWEIPGVQVKKTEGAFSISCVKNGEEVWSRVGVIRPDTPTPKALVPKAPAPKALASKAFAHEPPKTGVIIEPVFDSILCECKKLKKIASFCDKNANCLNNWPKLNGLEFTLKVPLRLYDTEDDGCVAKQDGNEYKRIMEYVVVQLKKPNDSKERFYLLKSNPKTGTKINTWLPVLVELDY